MRSCQSTIILQRIPTKWHFALIEHNENENENF